MAFRLALVYDRLAPLAAAGHDVVASGGALLHSPAWAQIVTDALGRPGGPVGGEAEASSRGAALLALEALGVARSRRSGLARPDPRSRPPSGTRRYRAARERQRRLYDNIVGL